jgi:hypothetical protein
MTENVNHVEVLIDMRGGYEEFRKHDEVRALDAAIAALQREAAGDGEELAEAERRSRDQRALGWDAVCNVLFELRPNWVNGEGTGIECATAVIREALTAPRPTGTDYSQCCDTPAYCASVRRCTAKDTTPASAEPGEDDPGEFGAGIQPNPKARYWQERADFWRNHAIALGYVADDGTQRYPPADVDHATAMESWHAAVNDASELFANCDDGRFASRASRVVSWIKANRPKPEARGGGEAVAEVGRDWTLIWYGSGSIASIARQHGLKVGSKLYSHPTPAALDAERLDWLAHHGVSIRNHSGPIDPGWFLVAPYHMGIPCVDDHKRFLTARAAIDAARATTGANGNG